MDRAARLDLIRDLKERTQQIESSRRRELDVDGVSTGFEALDQLLPGPGLAWGTLVEWLNDGEGSGAFTLALSVAAKALQRGGAFVMVDGERNFILRSPPAGNSARTHGGGSPRQPAFGLVGMGASIALRGRGGDPGLDCGVERPAVSAIAIGGGDGRGPGIFAAADGEPGNAVVGGGAAAGDALAQPRPSLCTRTELAGGVTSWRERRRRSLHRTGTEP